MFSVGTYAVSVTYVSFETSPVNCLMSLESIEDFYTISCRLSRLIFVFKMSRATFVILVNFYIVD